MEKLGDYNKFEFNLFSLIPVFTIILQKMEVMNRLDSSNYDYEKEILANRTEIEKLKFQIELCKQVLQRQVNRTNSKKLLLNEKLENQPKISSMSRECEKFLEKTPLLSYKGLFFTFQLQTRFSELESKNITFQAELEELHNKYENLQAAMSRVTQKRQSKFKIMEDGEAVLNESAIERRLEELEKTYRDLESERSSRREQVVMHLLARVQSLQFGRNYPFIWRIKDFKTIFDVSKLQYDKTRKLNESNSICSPLFYTGSKGYLMYLRIYPFGCDSGTGKSMSICLALSPGEYDGLLEWPFRHQIRISLLDQIDFSEKWVKIVTPDVSNQPVFNRPTDAASNPGVSLPNYISHW